MATGGWKRGVPTRLGLEKTFPASTPRGACRTAPLTAEHLGREWPASLGHVHADADAGRSRRSCLRGRGSRGRHQQPPGLLRAREGETPRA